MMRGSIAVKSKLTKMSADAIFLLAGVALIPLYLFDSGGVQPAHLILFWFAALHLVRIGLHQSKFALLMLITAFYTLIVEVAYIFLGGDPEFIINSLFLFYNLIIVVAVSSYCRKEGASIILPGVVIAASIAVITVLVSGVSIKDTGEYGRSTGGFNNPNQLGFFSVCLLSITYILYRAKVVGYMMAVLLFAAAIFLAISSLSKAAIAANFIVVLFALKPSAPRKAVFLWGIGAVGTLVFLTALYLAGAFDDYLFVQRMVGMADEADSSLVSRGYWAILQGNGLQIIFGLGAELVAEIVGHEVHSTFASFLSNYGVVGLLLFSMLIFLWISAVWRHFGFMGAFCIAGPAILYGITHNGSRFTMFWLLVAISLGLVQRKLKLGSQATASHRAAWPGAA